LLLCSTAFLTSSFSTSETMSKLGMVHSCQFCHSRESENPVFLKASV
jgi:hypothetical protein